MNAIELWPFQLYDIAAKRSNYLSVNF